MQSYRINCGQSKVSFFFVFRREVELLQDLTCYALIYEKTLARKLTMIGIGSL